MNMVKFYKKRGKAIWKRRFMADVGRCGFVVLKYYKTPHGFEDTITFTDSVALFEGLWEEWLNTKSCIYWQKAHRCWRRAIKVCLRVCRKKNSRNLSGEKPFSQEWRE